MNYDFDASHVFVTMAEWVTIVLFWFVSDTFVMWVNGWP